MLGKATIITCLIQAISSVDIALDPRLQKVFEPNSEEESYQRKYIINVAPKAEDCYYIPDIKLNQIINIHFVVVNAGRAGQQMDITWKVRGPGGRVVNFLNRRVEGQLIGYRADQMGDYEVCFSNRFSMFEPKRVFWQFEVEGALDDEALKAREVNATLEYFMEASLYVEGVVRKVRSGVAKTRHQQWWIGSMSQKHQSRLDAVQSMIDRWSMAYLFMLIVVGFGQVFMLRRLFYSGPGLHKMSARA